MGRVVGKELERGEYLEGKKRVKEDHAGGGKGGREVKTNVLIEL